MMTSSLFITYVHPSGNDRSSKKRQKQAKPIHLSQNAGQSCSAGFQPAVSPIFNRQKVIAPRAIRVYSRSFAVALPQGQFMKLGNGARTPRPMPLGFRGCFVRAVLPFCDNFEGVGGRLDGAFARFFARLRWPFSESRQRAVERTWFCGGPWS